MSYLGHVVGQGRLEPEEDKVAVVRDYPTPLTKKDVRAFIVLVKYYRRFIPQFAAIETPLTNLTKKKKPDTVLWNEDCERAFQRLKEALLKKPVLKVADATKPFILQTDASSFGLGAVLNQTGEDGCEHPVSFANCKLLPREVKYSTVEKEGLAIVWALKVFHVYVYGQSFTVGTDHKPLMVAEDEGLKCPAYPVGLADPSVLI